MDNRSSDNRGGGWRILPPRYFTIFMPLIYGEGKSSALRRLQRVLEGIPATGIVYTNNFTRR